MKYTIFTSMVFLMLFIFGGMVMVSQVRAEDNKTIEFDDRGWPKILDEDEWRSQLEHHSSYVL